MVDFIYTTRSTLKTRMLMLIITVVALLIIGTFVYHAVEDWSYMDAFYFSSISLSTRGYGELHPTTAFSKIFTVFYLFIGVAFILYTMSSFIGYFVQQHEPKLHKKVNLIKDYFAPPKKDKWVVIDHSKKNQAEEEFSPKRKIKWE
ncbi:hypothetical protein COY27_04315 [Candidatus Woesearchaeota archaeon CG_4_10_14_0_2_um_filter_33_13]|nr:MAG: hypothetical protein COY27_04315 [Candidatus Woesearchaeota archaeon CG_4_10_14_0_2_um_filter_33_13]